MHMDLIPDISVVGRGYYTLLYEMELPELGTEIECSLLPFADEERRESISILPTSRSLHFEGINYRATVWWNNERILPANHPPGMFSRHSYTLGSEAGSVQLLIEPPDHPGIPDPQSQGGRDHAMAQDGAVPQYMAGWDWVAAVPDRATGVAGAVVLQLHQQKPQLVDCAIQTLAILGSCDADMTNCNNIHLRILATVKGEVEEDVSLRLRVSSRKSLWDIQVVPSSSGEIQHEVIAEETLCLWWPHNSGSSNPTAAAAIACLETFDFSLVAHRADGGVNNVVFIDQQKVQVGIRTVDSHLDQQLQGQRFRINGYDVYLVGGNWIGTDLTWRYSDSPHRYCDEIGLHRHAGLNLLRVWGGGVAERSHFYNCADRLGILVLQEFWMTGDQNGRWAGSFDWPLDHDAYLYNVRDTVLRLRSHASLLFYVGCNECLAPFGKSNPPIDIDVETQKLVETYDPGRFYIASSMGGVSAMFLSRFAAQQCCFSTSPIEPTHLKYHLLST